MAVLLAKDCPGDSFQLRVLSQGACSTLRPPGSLMGMRKICSARRHICSVKEPCCGRYADFSRDLIPYCSTKNYIDYTKNFNRIPRIRSKIPQFSHLVSEPGTGRLHGPGDTDIKKPRERSRGVKHSRVFCCTRTSMRCMRLWLLFPGHSGSGIQTYIMGSPGSQTCPRSCNPHTHPRSRNR